MLLRDAEMAGSPAISINLLLLTCFPKCPSASLSPALSPASSFLPFSYFLFFSAFLSFLFSFPSSLVRESALAILAFTFLGYSPSPTTLMPWLALGFFPCWILEWPFWRWSFQGNALGTEREWRHVQLCGLGSVQERWLQFLDHSSAKTQVCVSQTCAVFHLEQNRGVCMVSHRSQSWQSDPVPRTTLSNCRETPSWLQVGGSS